MDREQILTFIKLGEDINIEVFSKEFQIILELLINGPTESSKLRIVTKNSVSSHNIYIKKLTQKEVIDFYKCKIDRRKIYYKLSEKFLKNFI